MICYVGQNYYEQQIYNYILQFSFLNMGFSLRVIKYGERGGATKRVEEKGEGVNQSSFAPKKRGGI